ncbi:hypothetical protein [Granulicella rosea]|nr:hypothetical protein [Granulicella rosea]
MVKRLFASSAVLVVLLTACNSKTAATPENYTAALNAWFVDHPECLLDGSVHFPLETTDAAQTKQMDSLVAAQILEAKKEPAIHITRYTLTTTGERAGTHLCYGHRQVTSIVSSTPPVQANGFLESNVTYGYKLVDTPMWAKTAEVEAAYPKMAEQVSGNAKATMTLARNRVAWVVPE